MATEIQKRALRILKETPTHKPREFARAMWPDAEAWRHHSKAGPHGSTRGGGMNLAGGAYLGRLRKAGLIRASFIFRSQNVDGKTYEWYEDGHRLTKAGKAAIQ